VSDFKEWWYKQNNLTTRRVPLTVIANVTWNAAQAQQQAQIDRLTKVVEAAKKSISFDVGQYIYDLETGNLKDRNPDILVLMKALAELEGES